MKKNAIFIFFILAYSFVFASDPAWVLKTPKQDLEFKYYVGRSMPSSTDLEANSAADKNAREQAVRDNFGATLKIDSTLIESSSKSNSQSRIEESSKRVNLIGFEFVEDHLQVNDEGSSKQFIKYILYKYSLKSIEAEKIRLSGLIQAEPVLSVTGSDSDCDNEMNTELTIKSSEKRSTVYINDEVVGQSPIKIKCKFAAGIELKITVDHKSFIKHEETVVLTQGDPKKINVILEPEFGKIVFRTVPSGAQVYVNGKDIGKSPTDPIEFQVGISKQVIFTHPDAEKLYQDVTLDKLTIETIDREFKLPTKYGTISLDTVPSQADVFIDGELKSIGETPLKNKICAYGNHSLVIEKRGYEQVKKHFDCGASKSTNLGTIELKENPSFLVFKNEIGGLHEVYWSFESPNFQDIEINKSVLGYNYSNKIIETMFRYKVGGAMGAGASTFSDAKLQQTLMRFNLGLPMLISSASDSYLIELEPEAQLNFSSFTLTNTKTTAESKTVNHSQISIGFNLSTGIKISNGYLNIKAGSFYNSDSGSLKGQSNYNISLGWGFQ